MGENTQAVRAAREYLNRVRRRRCELANKQERIEALRDLATGTAGSILGLRRSDSPDVQQMETIMCKVVDLEREIADDRKELEQAQRQVADVLCELDDTREQRILFARYLECRSWPEIAAGSGYAHCSLFRYHAAGLRNVEKILGSKGRT